MSEKHIFSDSDGLVVKSLRGAVALNPVLRLYVQKWLKVLGTNLTNS